MLLLLTAGCSEDDAETPEASASPTTASASPSPAADSGAEAAAAARINLTAADLGPGWTSTPPEPPAPADDATERALYACVGITPTDPIGDDVSSPSFTNAAEAEISSSVDFYAGAEDARAELTAFSAAKGTECLRSSLESILTAEVAAAGGTVASVSLTRNKAIEVVPDSIGVRVSASVNAQGQTLTVTGDLLAIVRGRVVAQVFAVSFGGEFPTAVLATAAKGVATRAAAESG